MRNVLLLVLLVILSSCGSATKLRKFKNFAYDQKNRVEVAKVCNDLMPCIEKEYEKIIEIQKDTLIIKGDSIEVECPLNPILDDKGNVKPIKVKCPDKEVVTETKTITETKYIEDTRKITIIQDEKNKLSEELNKLKNDNENLSNDLKSKNKQLTWLVIAVGLYISFRLVKSYFKSKKIF